MPKGVYHRSLTPDQRFDRRIAQSGDCRVWTGPVASSGYGNFWFEGKYIGAHVYAWIRGHGPLKPGEAVRHGPCHNRLCCREDHLTTGTKGDNNRDRQRDGTQTRGSAHHSSVLTEELILEAQRRRALGVPFARIARDLGVNASTLYDAVTHRKGSWLHVKDDA